MKHSKLWLFSAFAVAALLSACGSTITEPVGGTVVGLSGGTSVVLQDNGTDNLTVSNNGTFTFPKGIDTGSIYLVTVLTQPAGEVCAVENATGFVSENIGPISSVVVNCVISTTAANDVYGTVSGLSAGAQLVLNDNGVDPLTITSTGPGAQSFTFAKTLQIGVAYTVSIQQQPSNGQVCTITQGASGTISASAALTPFAITCQ